MIILDKIIFRLLDFLLDEKPFYLTILFTIFINLT